MSQMKSVGLGEWFVTADPVMTIAAIGLGSCVGVAAYDPVAKLAGMIHIVLPDSGGNADGDSKTKFADQGLPVLFDSMYKQGAKKERLVVKICGGAQMLSHVGVSMSFNIGERNVEAVKKILKEMGLVIRGEQVGGVAGRTLKLYVNTGRITVRTVGSEEKDL
ncbi:MAG: chemotaxis protein CheD [Nitrospirota bacterium]|nr:chemotaxis protein CheD [Nitrospirota bacterium]